MLKLFNGAIHTYDLFSWSCDEIPRPLLEISQPMVLYHFNLPFYLFYFYVFKFISLKVINIFIIVSP